MNISLNRRISASFIGANLVVLAIGFTVFYFLQSLNSQIEDITTNTNQINLLNDEIRISSVSILKTQKRIIINKANKDDLEKLNNLVDSFHTQLQRLDTYYSEVEIKTTISKMLGYVDSLKTLLAKVSLFDKRDNAGLSTISDLMDKILEAFSEFQDIQYYQNERRDKKIKEIIGETRRNMLIVLIITFLGTILMSLVIPGKIALPFKKISDAVRELQDCNFDVSIYYDQDDEIGELAREINKMIGSMKKFEELRTDRINVEHRKFDVLANMIRRNVLIANATGELIYLNNHAYKLLNVDSEDVLNKNMEDTIVPKDIQEAFDVALKRRSKIENAEIVIAHKKKLETTDDDTGEIVETEVEEEVFNGFANVIPIRAKESGLDYYMMILSREMFA
jgi:nitrogen fixation/metabolism regulation signal transduction histidine kinase